LQTDGWLGSLKLLCTLRIASGLRNDHKRTKEVDRQVFHNHHINLVISLVKTQGKLNANRIVYAAALITQQSHLIKL
jgi:hypothetical protein